MSPIYWLKATNYKSKNPDINTLELFFADKKAAQVAVKKLKADGYKCSKMLAVYPYEDGEVAAEFAKSVI